MWEIQEDGTFALRDLRHGSLLGVGVDLWGLRELFAHLDLHLQMLSGFTKVWQQPLRSLEGWTLKRADPREKAGPRRCLKWSPLRPLHAQPCAGCSGAHRSPCPAGRSAGGSLWVERGAGNADAEAELDVLWKVRERKVNKCERNILGLLAKSPQLSGTWTPFAS